jgi:hypothetical protein
LNSPAGTQVSAAGRGLSVGDGVETGREGLGDGTQPGHDDGVDTADPGGKVCRGDPDGPVPPQPTRRIGTQRIAAMRRISVFLVRLLAHQTVRRTTP